MNFEPSARMASDALAAERELPQMSRSAERPSAVHSRTGEPCPVCGDVVRAVVYRDYSVNYCAGNPTVTLGKFV